MPIASLWPRFVLLTKGLLKTILLSHEGLSCEARRVVFEQPVSFGLYLFVNYLGGQSLRHYPPRAPLGTVFLLPVSKVHCPCYSSFPSYILPLHKYHHITCNTQNHSHAEFVSHMFTRLTIIILSSTSIKCGQYWSTISEHMTSGHLNHFVWASYTHG